MKRILKKLEVFLTKYGSYNSLDIFGMFEVIKIKK